MLEPCCATCRRCYEIERWDYTGGGCEHTKLEGHACTALSDEGRVLWMTGLNGEVEKCEMWEGREK